MLAPLFGVRDELGGEYLLDDRGAIDVKGLGEMRTLFPVGRRP
ncbi:MAG: hypothetical protein ACR2H0_07150 [Candidatus Limnocylindrales bacterium]